MTGTGTILVSSTSATVTVRGSYQFGGRTDVFNGTMSFEGAAQTAELVQNYDSVVTGAGLIWVTR